jgi:hypothetical protein
MTGILQAIERDPERQVEIAAAPDEICRACPHLQGGKCRKNGRESEARVHRHDARVLRRLRMEVGKVLPARLVFRRVEQGISPDDLRELCRECQWLPLGYCREGLRAGRISAASDWQVHFRSAGL